jgi:hypothetical protein
MAGKRKASKVSKRKSRKFSLIDDTQRTMEIRSASSSVSLMTAHVPDLLMRANRRQYAQCRAYDVRVKVGLVDEADEHSYEIFTLSNAWWVKRAKECRNLQRFYHLSGDRRGRELCQLAPVQPRVQRGRHDRGRGSQ